MDRRARGADARDGTFQGTVSGLPDALLKVDPDLTLSWEADATRETHVTGAAACKLEAGSSQGAYSHNERRHRKVPLSNKPLTLLWASTLDSGP